MKVQLILMCIFFSFHCVHCDECTKLDISITQKVEHEGFHRNILWLIESTHTPEQKWFQSDCKFSIKQDIPNGMFVNPDEIADLNRTGELISYIDGIVDVEAPAHESQEHIIYVFLNQSDIERASITLPVHMRYQRSQITGGYGKVLLRKPSLLMLCSESSKRACVRGLKVEAPCDETAHKVCIWKNFSYQALFDEVELYVPVGDLDDYPLVSIVTLLLGCTGCIYILSVLSTTPL
ncbi:unnamed protein product [Phaedon cochleariae]|uniref:Phosphatidylinositol-glycan biosynthesis class X protein n=1 Tax=Phaedon cochleariae TaxID=80249 RepID=A0A9P0GRJ4_PHACE|nr:unnamed protein product [Phaedon cochleariae]